MSAPEHDDPGNPLYWQKILDEAGSSYVEAPTGPPSLQTLRQLYTNVLSNYGFTCALTGQQFDPPDDFLHDKLQIVAIQPLAAGGALHVRNFLCLTSVAANAFRRGHLAVGPAFQIIVDLSHIDPELLEALNPIGRLRLPEMPIGRPDPDALAFHRVKIFLVA